MNREAFNELCALPDGPEKKFKLIATFGKAIRDHYEIDGMILDPRILACGELVDIISELFDCELSDLAAHARCVDDHDWGSDRQITAFNKFTTVASEMMTPEQQAAWDRFSMKATSDEIVDEAMRILGKA